ncbi:hypothetical protein PoB_000418800 [Plakobranchus ocellatus]|uniref:Uncharacterized protein n=1 Tax=Plakobranchus ocellatus TaxID=259542 RepID=A0AAV3Y5H5_9GAST|nr:hypothetical protein PoB_000418800 [Plakobranchus ocellatus]
MTLLYLLCRGIISPSISNIYSAIPTGSAGEATTHAPIEPEIPHSNRQARQEKFLPITIDKAFKLPSDNNRRGFLENFSTFVRITFLLLTCRLVDPVLVKSTISH